MPLKSDHNAVWKENRNVVIKKNKKQGNLPNNITAKKRLGNGKMSKGDVFS